MTEHQLADRMRAAVAGEPPLGFDPDEVVDRAIRRSRRRAGATATALGTVTLAVAAVAVTSALGSGPGEAIQTVDPASPGTATLVPPPPKNATGKTPSPTFPGSADAAKRLGDLGPILIAQYAPGVPVGKPDSGTWQAGTNPRSLIAAYRVQGTTHRYVTLGVVHEKNKLDLDRSSYRTDGSILVSDTVNPDGSHLQVYRFGQSGDAQALTVLHIRTNGVIAIASTTSKPEPGRTGLVVGQQVLTALATDPRLSF
jgi:hypothetical protein